MTVLPRPVRIALPPAAILCGGLGTRLRPVVPDRPKALAPIAGRPFLAWLLDFVAAQGVTRAILCTGFGADQIEAEFGSQHGSLELLYSREPAALGTAGALRYALPQIESTSVMVLNGDSFCHANLASFWQQHAASGAAASMLLARVDDSSRYGSVEVAENGLVAAFREKSTAAGAGWINAGIYILDTALVAAIPAGRALSLERDFFPQWTRQGLRGAKSKGEFIDIGTPESFAAAAAFFQSIPEAAALPSSP